jgi:hypothetical protein
MTHLHHHMTDPNTMNGHMLTASAYLIDNAPQPVTALASWMTPNAEIERLFHLASNLGLEGELTPVEAWNRIWQHPEAGRLTAQGLKTIELGLKALVACYG